MRKDYLLVLAVAAVALAGCKGGSTDAPGLNLCGLNCIPEPQPEPEPEPEPEPDPDEEPPVGGGGNTTSLDSGDTTIALEFSKLVSPAGGSLSKLTQAGDPDPETNTAKIEVDTKTEGNAKWPVPKTMNEYDLDPNSAAPQTELGGRYKEYRALTSVEGSDIPVDEELQVWSWKHSYATQYRNVAAGGVARAVQR